MKALLINRVGDIGLVLAMLMIIDLCGGLEYSTVTGVMCVYSVLNSYEITLLGICLFLGALVKSAQFGLHT
jgi:NADH-quinone oxidoreductase subunit L